MAAKVELYGISETPITYKLSDFSDYIDTLVKKVPF